MTGQQIPKLVASLVEFQKSFSVLSNEEAQWVIQHTEEAIDVMAQAVKNFKKSQEKILELVEPKIIIPAMTKKFVAKDNFIVDVSEKAKVKISYLGDNFREWFLGKAEESIGEVTLCSNKLLAPSVDEPIISELGGEGKVETKLAHIFHLVCQQPNGEEGTLLVSGWANVFYVRDKDGNLCTVYAYWDGDGWRLDAYSVGNPRRWFDGRYVFSPQFLSEI